MKMKCSVLIVVVVNLFLINLCSGVHAAVPQTINYQGILKNATGTPVNGTVSMQFSLYSAPTSTSPLWSEVTPTVTVVNGRYSVVLGNTTPINLTFDAQYYLGVKVGADAEMSPRQPLTSTAYAMKAKSVENGSVTAASIGENCAEGEFLIKTAAGWSCGSLSVFPNAIASCVSSTCKLACTTGYGNCNNVSSDGCEMNILNNADHCGVCGHVCPTQQNASRTCSNGTCGMGACNAGWANCDADMANGCETDILNDLTNCGFCGHECSGAQGSSWCAAGVCEIECSPGYGNCNGLVDDGCETNMTANPANCGSCGHVCPSGVCSNGVCQLLAQGTACSVDGACATGHCTDGYCCNSGYTSPCMACNLTVKGTYSPLPAGWYSGDYCGYLGDDGDGNLIWIDTGCNGAGGCNP